MTAQIERDCHRFSILFVDDEEKALKYFSRAFSEDMTVLTASSVEEAIVVLERDADNIGVLITDQRMPDKNGVALLRHVREYYPTITRILTTAYSELDDAIAAVNSGEIFRYITKPWDLRILRGELLQAMDYFVAQHERDLLIKEKLTVWQNLSSTSSLRDLLVMAAGFSHIRHSLHAVNAYLTQLPACLKGFSNNSPDDYQRGDMWEQLEIAIIETHELAKYLLHITEAAIANSGFDDDVEIQDYLHDLLKQRGMSNKINFTAESRNEGLAIKANRILLERLFILMLDSVFGSTPSGMQLSLHIEPIPETHVNYNVPGIRILATVGGADNSLAIDNGNNSTAIFQREMLAIFLVSYHHGGRVVLNEVAGTHQSLEVVLPNEPLATCYKEPEQGWLNNLIVRYEENLIDL